MPESEAVYRMIEAERERIRKEIIERAGTIASAMVTGMKSYTEDGQMFPCWVAEVYRARYASATLDQAYRSVFEDVDRD